eukprot:scaffold8339_cov220-Pinguiococcus_pyrenoidosus.AAC.1
MRFRGSGPLRAAALLDESAAAIAQALLQHELAERELHGRVLVALEEDAEVERKRPLRLALHEVCRVVEERRVAHHGQVAVQGSFNRSLPQRHVRPRVARLPRLDAREELPLEPELERGGLKELILVRNVAHFRRSRATGDSECLRTSEASPRAPVERASPSRTRSFPALKVTSEKRKPRWRQHRSDARLVRPDALLSPNRTEWSRAGRCGHWMAGKNESTKPKLGAKTAARLCYG